MRWLAATVLLAGVLAGCGGGSGPPTPTGAIPTRRPHTGVSRRQGARAAGARGRAAPSVGPAGPYVDVLASLPEAGSRCEKAPAPVAETPITRTQWLSGVTITEYYPAPERWFAGRHVAAPGLSGTYAVDWLYSARGLAMEGDGVDDEGHPVHIAALGSTGWVNRDGGPTLPVCLGKWSDGFPVWLRGGWRNAQGQVTYPLGGGGWANGSATGTRPYGGVTFAAGSSQPLRYYHSVAVDPGLIPRGSRIYIPAYRAINGGWFVAQDTGGAIRGPHIDVYRPPPARPDDLGRYLTGQRVLVIPPSG